MQHRALRSMIAARRVLASLHARALYATAFCPWRWQVVPTPLTRLRWWRVCLDEAQMVESSTAKAAEMALKLDAQHRWAITGTPLSRGLEDLFGLLVRTQPSVPEMMGRDK